MKEFYPVVNAVRKTIHYYFRDFFYESIYVSVLTTACDQQLSLSLPNCLSGGGGGGGSGGVMVLGELDLRCRGV